MAQESFSCHTRKSDWSDVEVDGVIHVKCDVCLLAEWVCGCRWLEFTFSVYLYCVWVCQDLRGDPRLMSLFIDDDLRLENINQLWEDFTRAQTDKNSAINDRLSRLNLSF